MFQTDNKKLFITSVEDNTVFGELTLQEAIYNGEELVSDSSSISLRQDFLNNELQDFINQNPTCLDNNFAGVYDFLYATDIIFGFNKTDVEII